MTQTIDPFELAQALIRCPSVTPEDAGALGVLQDALEGLGFACHRLVFSAPGTADVDNLYARLGDGAPNFCYAGHTDVVPVGDAAAWTVDPFGAEVIDGRLHGRGAVDMKCAIACFVAAAARFLADHGSGFGGSLSLLITGDEEGPAVNGTAKVLDWLAGRGEALDACLVGEPTNPEHLGEINRMLRLQGFLSVLRGEDEVRRALFVIDPALDVDEAFGNGDGPDVCGRHGSKARPLELVEIPTGLLAAKRDGLGHFLGRHAKDKLFHLVQELECVAGRPHRHHGHRMRVIEPAVETPTDGHHVRSAVPAD